MPGYSDLQAQRNLDFLTGGLAMVALPSVWAALFTTAPTSDAGTGGTEVSGGSYARVQVAGNATVNGTTAAGNATLHFAATPAWIVPGMTVRDLTTPASISAGTTVLSTTGTTVVMSANAAGAGVGATDVIVFSAWPASSASVGTEPATTPASVTNGAAVTFPAATVSWGSVLAFGLYDASSAGNLLAFDFLGAFQWLPATNSSASPGVITAKAHGYSANDPVVITTKYGGTLPSFSQSSFTNTAGTLLVVSPTTDTFTLTNGGTAVNTSSTGDFLVRKILVQSIPSGITASFAAATLTLTGA